MKKWLMFALALCLVVLSACSRYSAEKPDWGITMTAENVTPTGCTLVLNKSDGNEAGTVYTGYSYFITRQGLLGWKELSSKSDVDTPGAILWGGKDGTTEWEISWKGIYGSLKPGNYRICKVFGDTDKSRTIKEQIFWAEFTIQ